MEPLAGSTPATASMDTEERTAKRVDVQYYECLTSICTCAKRVLRLPECTRSKSKYVRRLDRLLTKLESLESRQDYWRIDSEIEPRLEGMNYGKESFSRPQLHRTRFKRA